MLKISGIIGLVVSFGLLGISKTTNFKIRIELLEDYYEMIMILKTQINYFKEPLPELFKKVSKSGNSKAFRLLEVLGSEIEEKNGNTADFWAKKVTCIYQDTVLTQEDIEILSYPGEFIGQTDFNNHLQHFSYVEEKLKKQIEMAKSLYESKGPMYNKIGFFIGAIIGIIFI